MLPSSHSVPQRDRVLHYPHMLDNVSIGLRARLMSLLKTKENERKCLALSLMRASLANHNYFLFHLYSNQGHITCTKSAEVGVVTWLFVHFISEILGCDARLGDGRLSVRHHHRLAFFLDPIPPCPFVFNGSCQ